MATLPLAASLPSPLHTKITAPSCASTSVPFVSLPLLPSIKCQHPKHRLETLFSPPYRLHYKARCVFASSALVDGESVATEGVSDQEDMDDVDGFPRGKKQARPCELYFCNIPRRYDIADIDEIFRRFGKVISVELSRVPETGVSRGSGYVTLDSVDAAYKAISALDGSDIDGREMRVRYSAQMKTGRRNPKMLNAGPTKTLFYETPHRIYVGNLGYDIKPESLRYHFGRFGTVVSTRVVFDRKEGKLRAYGFLSFSSVAERDAALSLNGTEFEGRPIVVRKGLNNTKV